VPSPACRGFGPPPNCLYRGERGITLLALYPRPQAYAGPLARHPPASTSSTRPRAPQLERVSHPVQCRLSVSPAVSRATYFCDFCPSSFAGVYRGRCQDCCQTTVRLGSQRRQSRMVFFLTGCPRLSTCICKVRGNQGLQRSLSVAVRSRPRALGSRSLNYGYECAA